MELFGLAFLVVALVLVGVRIAIGLDACTIAAVLVGLGMVGLILRFRRHPQWTALSRAARLLLQCGIVAGLPAGALCGWIAHSIFEKGDVR